MSLRTEGIKEKVDRGEVLLDSDISFLQRVFLDSQSLTPLLERQPEYNDIAARVMPVCKEITTKALANEQARNP